MKKLIIYLFVRFIIKPHYNVIVKRGLIKKDTWVVQFISKIKEEYTELEKKYTKKLIMR